MMKNLRKNTLKQFKGIEIKQMVKIKGGTPVRVNNTIVDDLNGLIR